MVPERNPGRGDAMEAAGERIVAFARSGKPPAIGFLRRAGSASGSRESRDLSPSRNGS